jgi:outer membrane protein assembly factor BamB
MQRLIQKCLFPALTAMLFTAQAADWPQWRGPNRDGIALDTGLLKEWPKEGPLLAWKATGIGGGYSTPSVAAGRVYGAGYKDGNEFIWALEAGTGKEVWSTKVASAFKSMGYPEGPRSTPTVDGDRIYTIGGGGNLVCLEAATGKVVWRKEFKSDFDGRMMSGWGYSESALVDGDKLLCTPGGAKGAIVALDKKTGELMWQTKDFTDAAAYASLLPAEIDGVRQFIQLTGESVVGVGTDGKLLWRAERKGKTAVIPTPIYHDHHVFVTSGYGIGCNGFKVSKSGAAFNAEQVYASGDLENHHGGVVRIGDYLYGHSGKGGWTCLEMKTGKVMWQKEGVGKGSVSYADGHLYCRSESGRRGTIALVAATPEGYQEKSRFDQPDLSTKNTWPHPVIANGKLLIRDQDVLLCYGIKAK